MFNNLTIISFILSIGINLKSIFSKSSCVAILIIVAKELRDGVLEYYAWLGWRDSNPRMPGPEPGALPLGDIPLPDNFTRKQYIFQGLALVFGAPLIDFGVIATQ